MSSRNWDELLTVSEVAREFRVSEESVRRWMKSGHLPYYPVGPFHIKRIRRGDILKNVKTGKTLEEEEDPIVGPGSSGQSAGGGEKAGV